MNSMTFGTAYYPDYFPENEWARDLDLMRSCGIRTVRILEFGWVWYQPTPVDYRFEPLDRFLDLCADRELAVCLSTPTATPPPWFFQKHPDCRMVEASGRPCFAHRHMVCWEHPEARAEAFRTIETLATRYGNHPAVWGWQIDNEPNFAEDPSACYDFNPHAIRRGQEWLRERHGSLEALNKAWFNAFWSQSCNEWEQVWVTHRPQVNPGSMLDFLRCREASVARFVQDQAALLRRCTTGQKIGVNIPEVGIPFSTVIAQDYWAQATGLDWIGTDLYTASGDSAADAAALRYSCDLMRSVVETSAPGADFFISETQGGPHIRSWACDFAGYPWEPGFLAENVAVYSERGASQVWFFLWRPVPGGQEIGMNATTDLDGGSTPFTAEIKRLASTAGPDAAAADYAARPLALVHYSQDTHRFMAFFKQLGALGDSHRGVHALLDRLGYRVAYLNDGQMQRAIPAADCLVLPESHVLSDRAQEMVLSWAGQNSSGRLILGPHTGLMDEHGQLRGPSRQVLWNALGLRPGYWRDKGISHQVGGHTVTAYRDFSPLEAGKHDFTAAEMDDSKTVALCLCPRPNIQVHTHRWGLAALRGAGAHSLPTEA